jgi:hypothetical protein
MGYWEVKKRNEKYWKRQEKWLKEGLKIYKYPVMTTTDMRYHIESKLKEIKHQKFNFEFYWEQTLKQTNND